MGYRPERPRPIFNFTNRNGPAQFTKQRPRCDDRFPA